MTIRLTIRYGHVRGIARAKSRRPASTEHQSSPASTSSPSRLLQLQSWPSSIWRSLSSLVLQFSSSLLLLSTINDLPSSSGERTNPAKKETELSAAHRPPALTNSLSLRLSQVFLRSLLEPSVALFNSSFGAFFPSLIFFPPSLFLSLVLNPSPFGSRINPFVRSLHLCVDPPIAPKHNKIQT